MNIRITALLLSLVLCLLSLGSCVGENDVNGGNRGERGEDGSWSEVDFGGEKLLVEVSGSFDDEGTFPACDIYTKGPDDKSTTDEIQKKVLIRNEKVKTELNIDVEYRVSTVPDVTNVYEHIEKYVLISSDDAPDVLDNDIYGLVRAMMNGLLWNISDPGVDKEGNEVYSYFDFSYDGWYTEYMRGASFDPEKLYLLAGDYHIDFIRYAWVFFVNVDLFDETFSSTDYQSYDYMVEYVTQTNEFLYEDLVTIATLGFRDTGKHKNEVDDGDQIGLCINLMAPRIFLACSGLSMIEWSGSSFGKGTPSVVASSSKGANALASLSAMYTDLYNTHGVLFNEGGEGLLKSVTDFFNGKVILTISKIGEMESVAMRGTEFERGLLPFPRYARGDDSDFVTIVHDQAEISCILNCAKSFSTSSAYLQLMNEESDEVLTEYYERALKFKYNENRSVRNMIDFIKSKITTPFESVLTVYLCDEASTKKQIYNIFHDCAVADNNAFSSTFAENQSAYQSALSVMLQKLAEQD